MYNLYMYTQNDFKNYACISYPIFYVCHTQPNYPFRLLKFDYTGSVSAITVIALPLTSFWIQEIDSDIHSSISN